MKVKATQSQLTLMEDIVSKMKKDKEKATKQVKEMEAALQGLITKIRVCSKMFVAGSASPVCAVGSTVCHALLHEFACSIPGSSTFFYQLSVTD